MEQIRRKYRKWLVIAPLFFSTTFANSLIAGGWVPERQNITISALSKVHDFSESRAVEIATLEIDNNLPNFQLVLEFSDQFKPNEEIEEVQLQGLSGTLGTGLSQLVKEILKPESGTSRFVWNPGPQQSATLNYQIRVWVTYKNSAFATANTGPFEVPRMMVSMPSVY